MAPTHICTYLWVDEYKQQDKVMKRKVTYHYILNILHLQEYHVPRVSGSYVIYLNHNRENLKGPPNNIVSVTMVFNKERSPLSNGGLLATHDKTKTNVNY